MAEIFRLTPDHVDVRNALLSIKETSCYLKHKGELNSKKADILKYAVDLSFASYLRGIRREYQGDFTVDDIHMDVQSSLFK